MMMGFPAPSTMTVQENCKINTLVMENLSQLRESGELCDFTIHVNGIQIKAHKCVLAAACEYFRSSFRFDSQSQSMEIDLSDMHCDATQLEKVIHSFYTNQIDLDPSCLEGILRLTDYFLCEHLRICVESYMELTLSFPTALAYFQLAQQYGLTATTFISKAKRLLFSRFHDYFIQQQEAGELYLETISKLIDMDVFQYCNPLQVLQFILRNLKHVLEKLHDSANSNQKTSFQNMCRGLISILQQLPNIATKTEPCLFRKWRPSLLKCLTDWKGSNLSEEGNHDQAVLHDISTAQTDFEKFEFPNDTLCLRQDACYVCSARMEAQKMIASTYQSAPCTNRNCKYRLDPFVNNIKSFMINAIHDKQDDDADDDPANKNADNVYDIDVCKCTPKALRIFLEKRLRLQQDERYKYDYNWFRSYIKLVGPKIDLILDKPDLRKCFEEDPRGAASSRAGASPPHDWLGNLFKSLNAKKGDPLSLPEQDFGNVVVVLSPTAEVSMHLIDSEDAVHVARGSAKPPELMINYYDIQMSTWRAGSKMKFPLAGSVLESHCWRMAFLNNCLYVFSLIERTGLEYNTVQDKWTRLFCEVLFEDHEGSSPVRSIIPVAVAGKLIVLSMSRQRRQGGTFFTEQRYFELDQATRKLTLKRSVHDERIDVPANQWTVSGKYLITVKTSSMIAGHISQIEYIHVYDAVSGSVETHRAQCALENGIKVLARDRFVYLLDKEGWCRAYDLDRSCWRQMKRFSSGDPGVSPGLYATGAKTHSSPLIRVSCQGGASRWQISSGGFLKTLKMEELVVHADGELNTVTHAPPPCLLTMAMCTGQISREQLDSLPEASFDYSEEVFYLFE